ncbi:hypothetical protein L6452_19569 [Arctium lappa]|uniref:Uncharacterized protein n=1 Tax=Arctium lappa TaxID=4217 RepID=A0ACB9B9U8_ARCLA|nr:hypothetical protein L6452_19569 [Arctium lappa]
MDEVVGFSIDMDTNGIGIDDIGIERRRKKVSLGGKGGKGGNLVVDTIVSGVRSIKGNGGIFRGLESGGLFDGPATLDRTHIFVVESLGFLGRSFDFVH